MHQTVKSFYILYHNILLNAYLLTLCTIPVMLTSDFNENSPRSHIRKSFFWSFRYIVFEGIARTVYLNAFHPEICQLLLLEKVVRVESD